MKFLEKEYRYIYYRQCCTINYNKISLYNIREVKTILKLSSSQCRNIRNIILINGPKFFSSTVEAVP